MRLADQRRVLVQALDNAQDQLEHLSAYLCSAKFDWPDNYVRTWEVLERVANAQTALADGLDTVGAYERQATVALKG